MAVARFFARFFYVPTMLVGLNGLALYLVAQRHSLLWIAILFAGAIALSLLSERFAL